MSQFRHPPPIEDLSDISWQRVERDLFTRLDAPIDSVERPIRRRPARWVAVAAIAAVAAAALLFFATRGDDSTPSPKLSRLVTEGAPSSITVGDAAITAAPHTALLVTDSGAGAQVILERGAVDCTIPPQQNRRPFVVIAGEVQVSVTGTQFSVARFGDSAEVVVVRGEVTVVAAGRRFRIGAGERWPKQTAHEPTPPEPFIGVEKVAPTAKAPKPRPAKVAKPKANAKQRFAKAARLERSDPRAALAIYRELERDPKWAATALYAQAELELRRGNKASARRLLTRYLRRFPTGPNAAIARSELARLDAR